MINMIKTLLENLLHSIYNQVFVHLSITLFHCFPLHNKTRHFSDHYSTSHVRLKRVKETKTKLIYLL